MGCKESKQTNKQTNKTNINLLIVHINTVGGWYGLFTFLEKINDSDLEGLKVTSHMEAHISILERSAFNLMAASRGSSTIM